MTPHRPWSVVCGLWSVVCSLSLASPPDLAWDVETSRLSPQLLEIRRGETLTLTPRFLLNSTVLPLTNSETCVLYYRAANMTTGLYYAITGAVHNATGGQTRVTWTATHAPSSATNLQADFVIASSNVINLRAYANIILRDSVFAQAATATNPPTVPASDIASITGQVAGVLINAPDLAWDVETSALSVKPLQIRRGETVTLTPRLLLNSSVISLTNTAQAALYYRAANMATGTFYAAAGTLHNATNGQVRINWTSSHCPASATNLQGEIIVLYPGVTNLRAAVSIALQDSIFSSALTASDPTSWRLIDWSSVSNINLSSAPFALSATELIWSNIGGDPASSTSLAAYIQSQVGGISAATATQIAQVVSAALFATGNCASASAAPWSGITGIPDTWPGAATDAVARAAASNAQATADAALTAESDPLSLHTQSVFSAWTHTGGAVTFSQVLAYSPLLTNGYASGSLDYSGGGGVASIQTSPDSNVWSAAAATNGPVYARVYVTIISPGDTLSVSNIAINSWLHPSLWHARPDLIGQIVLTDTPSESRQIANKSYVDAATASAVPSAWASYPASTNVSLANHLLNFGNAYSVLSTGAYSAWSYTPVTMSAGTDDVWRLQYGGQDIMRLEPSYTLLAITNFVLDSSNHFAASVWTGGVTATPYIQYTTNLLAPSWSAVSLDTNSYPTEITTGSYYLRWTNVFPSPCFFRAACGDSASNTVRFLWPLYALQGGGNVVTNGATGVTLTGTLTPTNSLTVTNALQLGGVAAASYVTNNQPAVTVGAITHQTQAIIMGETADDNFGIESESYPVTGLTNSVWFGYYAGYGSSGQNNNYIGMNAGYSTKGNNNNGMGHNALSQVNGSYNTGVGPSAGQESNGSQNTSIGYLSGVSAPGSHNGWIGYAAGWNAAGSGNTGIGEYSFCDAPGNYNAGLGAHSGIGSTGSYLTVVGYAARQGGMSNVMVGANTGSPGTKLTNAICLGAGTVPLGNNTMVLGNLATTQTVVYGDISLPATTGRSAPATVTDRATLWATNASGAELWVTDGSGNSTLLSSENENNEMIRRTVKIYKGVTEEYNLSLAGQRDEELAECKSADEMLAVHQKYKGRIYRATPFPAADWRADEKARFDATQSAIAAWEAIPTPTNAVSKPPRPEKYEIRSVPSWARPAQRIHDGKHADWPVNAQPPERRVAIPQSPAP